MDAPRARDEELPTPSAARGTSPHPHVQSFVNGTGQAGQSPLSRAR